LNEQQAYMAIRNAIRLENLGRNAAAKVTPELVAVMKQVRELISAIPAETLLRDMTYRRVLLQIAPLFRGVNDHFLQTLSAELRKEVVEQAKWAEAFLRVADLNPNLQPGGITTAPVSSPPAITFGPANFELGSAVTRTQLMALADDTRVLGGRLTDLFGWGDEADSPYMKSVLKKIDRVVKAGFLAGDTNEQIAKNLAIATNGQIQDARAIARTAVMDMSQRAHERFWDANSDVIKFWEYDATFDYRVCPLCFPHDGKRVKNRSDLPSVPVHPNCRCRVLPLTATALELEKEDMAEGMTMSTVQVGDPKAASGTVRPYKTKARFRKQVKGKQKTVTMPKFAQDVEVPEGSRPTMGFFMGKATADTRRAVLGETRAKEFEYLTSDNRGPRRTDLDEVLRQVTLADAESLAKAQRARGRRKS
jgi:SPP1 gp7 family putative phage head morphogenesis protein